MELKLTGKYRIIDLSPALTPGKEDRRMELRPWRWPADGSLMHDIDMMSHVGVHIEMPSHWIEGARDSATMPLETFFGDCVVLQLHYDTGGASITVEDLKVASKTGIRKGDTVFVTSKHPAGSAGPIVSDDAARWLVAQGIKMFGFDSTTHIDGKTGHDIFLGAGVPMVERLANLAEAKRERVFLIALPLKINGLESSPVRAMALEEI